MRAAYRVGQFWKALTAAPEKIEINLAREVLSPPLMALFLRLQPSEQAHSLSIAQALYQQGETHPDLLVAALLHDIGKTRFPLRIWERLAIVLGKRFFPQAARKWGQEQNLPGWKRLFVVAEQHPAWGAQMASEAGASSLAVALIRRHQEKHTPVSIDTVAGAGEMLENHLHYRLQILDEES